jgi:hypothetical protein
VIVTTITRNPGAARDKRYPAHRDISLFTILRGRHGDQRDRRLIAPTGERICALRSATSSPRSALMVRAHLKLARTGIQHRRANQQQQPTNVQHGGRRCRRRRAPYS